MSFPPQDRTPRRETFQGRSLLVFPGREDMPASLLPIYDFWAGDCGGALPIPRQAFDPLRIPREMLPWLFIINIDRDPLEFEYRLIGTGLTKVLSRDLTGRQLSPTYYPAGHADFLLHRFRMVAEQGVVVLASFDAGWVDKTFVKLASLMMPGSTDGVATDLIYGATVRDDAGQA